MADIDKKAENQNADENLQQENDSADNAVHSSLRDLIANAGSALDELASDVEAATSEGADEAVGGKSGKKRSRKKSQKEIVGNVKWNQEVSGLDIIDNDQESDAQAQEDATLNKFEELARRVAATVSKREMADEMPSSILPGAMTDMPENEMGMEMPETENITLGISESMDIETMAAEGSMESETALNDGMVSMEQISMEMISGELSSINGVSAELESEIDTELDALEAADGDLGDEIGDETEAEGPKEFIEADQLMSVIESLLFSTDKPVSLATIKQIFKGSNIRTKDVTRALDMLASEYASSTRGVTLEEINGGYQLRTKSDNSEFLRRLAKVRPFKLSGPSLEVMSIVAYKQPITKHEIDEIRGVESGHLLRALMERSLVCFNGKSELPGKPMTYGTTRKFLETFGLRNLRELPTMSEIEELLPEGIGEVEEKETLSDITDSMSHQITSTYSEGEDELLKINEQLQAIDTTSEFFEQEKQRERDRKDRERAQDIRERLVLGDSVEDKDRRWLDRYEAKLAAPPVAEIVAEAAENVDVSGELEALSAESEEMAQAAALADADEIESDEDLIGNESWDEELESESTENDV